MSAFKSTILITGGTTGLGYFAAHSLAQQCPDSKVIIASRSDKTKAADSLNAVISKSHPPSGKVHEPQVIYLPLDLSSTTNIRTFVKAHFDTHNFPPISKLLLNAGLQFYKGTSVHLTPDGIETTFGINHVGHALLFFLLKPHLTSKAHIVITSSGTHDPAQKTAAPDAVYTSAELLAHPTDNDGYETKRRGLQRYATSKLTNVLFGYALNRRIKSSNSQQWTMAIMDPGLMPGTSLARDLPPVLFWIFVHIAPHLVWLMRLLVYHNTNTPQKSGTNLAYVAMDEKADDAGKYFEGRKVIPTSKDSYDETKQEDLWAWTVQFLARDQKEKEAFEAF